MEMRKGRKTKRDIVRINVNNTVTMNVTHNLSDIIILLFFSSSALNESRELSYVEVRNGMRAREKKTA